MFLYELWWWILKFVHGKNLQWSKCTHQETIINKTEEIRKKKSLVLLTVSRQARAYIKAVIPKSDHVSQFLESFVKIETLEILIQELWGRVQVFVFFPQFSQVIPSTARSEKMARALAVGKSLVMGWQLTCLFSPTSCTLVKSHQLQTGWSHEKLTHVA